MPVTPGTVFPLLWSHNLCLDCDHEYAWEGAGQDPPPCPECESSNIERQDTPIMDQLFEDFPQDMQDLYTSFFDLYCTDTLNFMQACDPTIVSLCRLVIGSRGGGPNMGTGDISAITMFSDIDFMMVVNHKPEVLDEMCCAGLKRVQLQALRDGQCLIRNFEIMPSTIVAVPGWVWDWSDEQPGRYIGWWYDRPQEDGGPIYIEDTDHLYDLFKDIPGCAWGE